MDFIKVIISLYKYNSIHTIGVVVVRITNANRIWIITKIFPFKRYPKTVPGGRQHHHRIIIGGIQHRVGRTVQPKRTCVYQGYQGYQGYSGYQGSSNPSSPNDPDSPIYLL